MSNKELIAPLPDDARFDAYYFGFDPTGVGPVDAILSAVAVAGKGSHHTESWSEENDYYYTARPGLVAGSSGADTIQKNAERSAEIIRALVAEIAVLKAAAGSPSTPVAGEQKHCGRGSCAAMEGHEGTCAEASGWAVDGEPERDELRGVVGGVLTNATNYPKQVGFHVLGRDMGPLINRTVDALIRTGYVKPRVVTTAEEVRCLPSGSFFTDSNGRGYIAMRSGPRRGYFGENAPEDGWAIPDLTSLPFTVHFVPPFADVAS